MTFDNIIEFGYKDKQLSSRVNGLVTSDELAKTLNKQKRYAKIDDLLCFLTNKLANKIEQPKLNDP